MVSVIIPVYNSSLYLNKCIESLLNQTYADLDIIIIDDGSNDNSFEICRKFELEDNRIRLYHQYNQGVAKARNKGLKKIKGDYVFFLDSDDFIAPKTIELLLNFSIKNKCDIVQGEICYTYDNYGLVRKRKFGTEKILNRKESIKELILQDLIKNFSWGKLYKRSLLNDLNFPYKSVFEDFKWSEEIINRCNKYGIVKEILYFYRQHKNSLTYNINYNDGRLFKAMVEREKFIKMNYPEMQYLIRQKINNNNRNHFINLFVNITKRLINKIYSPYEKIKIHY